MTKAGLPSDVHLTIEQQTPAVFPVLSFNVVPGDADAADPLARARLAEWAEQDLKPRIAPRRLGNGGTAIRIAGSAVGVGGLEGTEVLG